MKGFKCPKCGRLHPSSEKRSRKWCSNADCDYSVFNSDLKFELVEIIDWEMELLPQEFNYPLGA